MKKLDQYRRIIQQVLERHAQRRPGHGQIEPVLICDGLLAVEELVGWAALPAAGDFYPTLPLSLTGDVGSVSPVADVDTGSREGFSFRTALFN
jgi:hypothetical protein